MENALHSPLPYTFHHHHTKKNFYGGKNGVFKAFFAEKSVFAGVNIRVAPTFTVNPFFKLIRWVEGGLEKLGKVEKSIVPAGEGVRDNSVQLGATRDNLEQPDKFLRFYMSGGWENMGYFRPWVYYDGKGWIFQAKMENVKYLVRTLWVRLGECFAFSTTAR